MAPGLGHIIRVNEGERVGADQVLGCVAQHPFRRRADVCQGVIGGEDEDDVRRVVDQRSEVSLVRANGLLCRGPCLQCRRLAFGDGEAALQIPQVKRLGEIIVGPGRKRRLEVVGAEAGGQDHHHALVAMRQGAEPATQLQPIHAW